MAKYKCSCSFNNKTIWELPPSEASKQVFTSESDARKWFEKEFPQQNIELTGYHFDGDHSTNLVTADGKLVGQIELYD